MNFKYTLGVILSLPLLPFLYFDGKKIKANLPNLPEALGIKGKHLAKNGSEKSLNILTIGESTIAGVGVKTHKEALTGSIAEELSNIFQVDINWKVYARSGYTVKKITKEVIPTITEETADLIVIGMGANDAFEANTPRGWRVDITQLIVDLKSKFPATPLVFCNMPPLKEFPAFTFLLKFTLGNLVEIFGEELQSLLKKHDNVFYHNDILTVNNWAKKFGLKGIKSDFFSDGIHPSKLTYQTWGKEIARLIANEKRITSTF